MTRWLKGYPDAYGKYWFAQGALIGTSILYVLTMIMLTFCILRDLK